MAKKEEDKDEEEKLGNVIPTEQCVPPHSLHVVHQQQLEPADHLDHQRHLYEKHYHTYCLHYYRSLQRLYDFGRPPTVQQLHHLHSRFDTDWQRQQQQRHLSESLVEQRAQAAGDLLSPMMLLADEQQSTLNRLMVELKANVVPGQPNEAHQESPSPTVSSRSTPIGKTSSAEIPQTLVVAPPAVVLRNPRGNQPRSYDPEGLRAALRDVQNGGSIYR